ncbi:MAG TPA: NUDIX domain-containing protein [bacterium]|nr:NUDIX domain-containing protein [bacterium]
MEYLDIVNLDDQPIGRASKAVIYKNNHLHRIVHVFVLNDKGEIALQLRAKNKSYCPHRWASSAGGHVQAGETFKKAGLRELREELGIDSPLAFLSKNLYDDPIAVGLKKFICAFTTKHNGPFQIEERELEKVEFFNVDQARELIKNEKYIHPEALFLLKNYLLKDSDD